MRTGFCAACDRERRWSQASARSEPRCPECGSEDFSPVYPAIPDLVDEPGVALMLQAESFIPRDERGAILTRDMLAWLRLHGVRRPSEVKQWEGWFVLIGSYRATFEAEEQETSMAKNPGEPEETD